MTAGHLGAMQPLSGPAPLEPLVASDGRVTEHYGSVVELSAGIVLRAEAGWEIVSAVRLGEHLLRAEYLPRR